MPAEPHPGIGELDPLLDQAPCGFLSFRDDGVVQHINRTLLDMLGYETAHVVGRHVEHILTVGSRIFYQTHWFPLLRMSGRAEEIFLMLRDAQGESIGVLVNAVRRGEETSAVYDCVLMRVRERQKYEDELLRARRTAEQARAELEQQQRELRQVNEQLTQQTIELELQQKQLHDQATELEMTGEELRATNDELVERTLELEQARAAADEANQAKSAFLAVMSHELRTPLNAIAGYADLIEMEVQGPINEAQRESLLRIKRSQRHLLGLINEILNLARIESGHVDYTIEELGVAELVDEVVPMIEPQLADRHLHFGAAADPSHVVRADREKVTQILLNLLGNAIKFTPEGGSIRVDSAAAGGAVEIAVADTGIGIEPAKLESIFEPFVQVDMSTTSRAEGTGLGLAISRDLARGMDGDLTAESEPGRGSTFTLRLPSAT